MLLFAHFGNGLLILTMITNPQIFITHSLKQRVLVLSHYPLTDGQPAGCKLYCSIKQHFYWSGRAVDCFATVHNCAELSENRMKPRCKIGSMKLFSATAPLQSVSIKILGELIRTQSAHRYILVITDRFTKLAKAIPKKELSEG